ncbi:MAG: hypothetical protein AAF500_01445 [Myxococcota bacterium]
MTAQHEDSSEGRAPASRSDPPRRSRKALRVVLAVIVGVLGLFAIALLGGLWVLDHLDHGWVKGPVQNALSRVIGTDVRYDRLSVSPSDGVHAEGFVIATPDALRPYAEEMLRIDTLDVPIEFGTLLAGDISIPKATAGAIEVTVVITDDGRDSWSELITSEDDPAEPATPLSHSLEGLRETSLTVGPVLLAPIRLRAVEVAVSTAQASGTTTSSVVAPDRGAVTRETRFDGLGVVSTGVQLGEEPSASAVVEAHDREHALLTVSDSTTSSPRTARIAPRVEIVLVDGDTVTLSAGADLGEQSLFPDLQQVRSLLRLESRATFAATEDRTVVKVDKLEAFDARVAANVTAVLDDAGPADSQADPPVEEDASLPFSRANLDGRGSIEMPSLPWSVPWLEVENLEGEFEIDDLQIEPAGVTAGTANLRGTVRSVHYATRSTTASLARGAWTAHVSAPADRSQTLGTLSLDASVGRMKLREHREFSCNVDEVATTVRLSDFGMNDAGLWELQGTGSVASSFSRGAVAMDGLSARSKGAVSIEVDLAKHEVSGSAPIKRLSLKEAHSDPVEIRDAKIDFAARRPTAWTSGTGEPTIDVVGSVGRVSVGAKHFRAPEWSIGAARTGPHRYEIQASATADQVNWGKFRREPPSHLSLEAEIDTVRPALTADAALSIAGEEATEIMLDASYDAPITQYELTAVGTEAGPLLGAYLFEDGGHRDDEFSFAFESRGRFRGLLSKNRSGTLVASTDPLRTMRGNHRSTLRVARLSLLRGGWIHQLGDLAIDARSIHESEGRGALETVTSLGVARYGDAARPIVFRDYGNTLEVAYAALHGAPSFSIATKGSLGKLDQPYVKQYPIAKVSFGAAVDVDDTQVFAVRRVYWTNPVGGTRFEARASYEGWDDAVRDPEVCEEGITGCPQVPSMYGREAAMVTGSFEQDFSLWGSTERTTSGGSLTMPFTVESGDLNTYRILATAELRDVVVELPDYGLLIDGLDALIPIDQELATEPRVFVVPTRAANAVTQKRFFDLSPFTERDSFLTAERVQIGRESIGPIAANLQVIGSVVAVDQLHAAYRDGFITGQFLTDLNRDDPEVAFRGHLTGVRVEDGKGVLDANVAMTFVPTTLIVDGKAQVVRVSKDHLYEIIDAIDPYHEDEDLNRVRLGLKFGYPKYVRIRFDEGLMDAKIDLGGLAGAVRIDEIKGIPVTPFLEQYVQPYLERLLSPSLTYEDATAASGKTPRMSQAPRNAGGTP